MALSVAEIDIEELDRFSSVIEDIYHRRLDVIIVRRALHQELASRVVDALSAAPEAYPWTPQQFRDVHREQMLVMGMTLTPVSGYDLDHDRYFRTARRFREAMNVLFEGRFEPRVEELLGRMSGGRRVRIPSDEEGRAYTPATVRKLPPGFGIPVHCGNFFLGTPGYRELARQIDLLDQLSYFFTLHRATEGGELEIYDLEWGDPRTPMLDETLYDSERIQKSHTGLLLSPPAGSLLLFDGGRYYHRVTPVGGSDARWTLGGFVGLSTDHQEVLYWS